MKNTLLLLSSKWHALMSFSALFRINLCLVLTVSQTSRVNIVVVYLHYKHIKGKGVCELRLPFLYAANFMAALTCKLKETENNIS